MNQENKRPVTIEDLLRLKRAEQPAAEFWDRFDRELRAKQLAALVEKRPWWRNLPRLVTGMSRYSLPIGATAVLALTFVVTRDHQTPVTGFDQSGTIASREVHATPTVATSVRGEQFLPAVNAVRETQTLMAESPSIAPAPAELVGADYAELDSRTGSAEASFASVATEAEEISPSARHIAANLAAARAAAPDLARGLLGNPSGFEERAMPARFATEPLEQVSTPEERSRARFATAMVASFNGDMRGRVVSANVARRISDDRVYDDDDIRRVGATGNSVAWRF